jgi:dynein heavy chain
MYTPTDDIIKRIFGEILRSHLSTPGFEEKLRNYSDKILEVTVMFFTRTIKNPQFSPSAKKFHYQFNFRELAKIMSGMLRSVPQTYKTSGSILRLWMHEVKRTFEDRFINNEDTTLFRAILKDSLSKTIGDFNEKDNPFIEPIIYTGFMTEFYASSDDMTELRRVMKDKLD